MTTDPYRHYRRGEASMMTWGIVIVVAILGIGGAMYAIASKDQSEATKSLNPPATSGSSVATPPATTSLALPQKTKGQ